MELRIVLPDSAQVYVDPSEVATGIQVSITSELRGSPSLHVLTRSMLGPSVSSNSSIIQSVKVLLQLDLWFGFKPEVGQHIRQIRAACMELLRSLCYTGGGFIKGKTEVIHHQANCFSHHRLTHCDYTA